MRGSNHTSSGGRRTDENGNYIEDKSWYQWALDWYIRLENMQVLIPISSVLVCQQLAQRPFCTDTLLLMLLAVDHGIDVPGGVVMSSSLRLPALVLLRRIAPACARTSGIYIDDTVFLYARG